MTKPYRSGILKACSPIKPMTDTAPTGPPKPVVTRVDARRALAEVIQQFRAAGVAIHWPPLVTLCSAVEALPHG